MDIPPDIAFKINEHKVLNLSYVFKSEVNSCAVFFVLFRGELCFLSNEKTRHGQALAKEPLMVAFTINRDYQDWKTIFGFQGKGITRKIEDKEERTRIMASYMHKFEALKESPKIVDLAMHTSLWAITPTWLRMIDNSVAFGYKIEFQ